MKELDLSDPQIRAMAERNHVPQELWTGGGELFDVTCQTCGNRWPCPTRQQLNSIGESRKT